MKSQGSQPVTLHLDATKGMTRNSPSPLLATWQDRLHGRGFFTVSGNIKPLFPWANMNMNHASAWTSTSEFTADVRWGVGRAGRKKSKQLKYWTNGLAIDINFSRYNFTGLI